MMEMVLQQSQSVGGGAGMFPGVAAAACRRGPSRPAATAPMMAKQEQVVADEQDQQQAAGEEEGAGDELRRGPWTVDEDLTLINYIADHGEGRWNALARAAGLKRTGKSCRLRWLNYLRPDVKRGDFTADEQLLILDLHSRWGNRWSKIAAHLPGRTDNEIKNYWRTRVQKHAKQLNCDVNSKRFKDAMRFLWMPRLAERATAAAAAHHHPPPPSLTTCVLGGGMAASSSSSALMKMLDAATVSNRSSCSPSSAVTCSSSSCSSLTSVDTAHDDGGARPHAASAAVAFTAADDDDYWGAATATTTTMQQQQQQQQNDQHYDFWSTASALQHLCTAADHDITGWVQGFSDGGILSGSSSTDNFWSLDDIWRMPQ